MKISLANEIAGYMIQAYNLAKTDYYRFESENDLLPTNQHFWHAFRSHLDALIINESETFELQPEYANNGRTEVKTADGRFYRLQSVIHNKLTNQLVGQLSLFAGTQYQIETLTTIVLYDFDEKEGTLKLDLGAAHNQLGKPRTSKAYLVGKAKPLGKWDMIATTKTFTETHEPAFEWETSEEDKRERQ